MAVMMLGAAMHAYIFSTFVSYMHKINHDDDTFSNKIDDVLDQMGYLQLPTQIQDRVILYYEYVNRCHKGLNDSEGGTQGHFFQQLPKPIHLGLAEHLHGTMVRTVPLFKDCSSGFFRGLVTKLNALVCIPDEYIVNKGDLALAMVSVALKSEREREREIFVCPSSLFGSVSHISNIHVHT